MKSHRALEHIKAFNERLNEGVFPRRTRNYVERFRDLTSELGGTAKVVLHLGAGRVDLEDVLPRSPFRPRLLTLDLSLEALRKNTAPWRVCGDAEALPLPSGSVDLIVSEHVFEHFPRPGACLRECCRILKQGGRLVVSGPNGWSYIALIARVTPLRLHQWVHLIMSGDGNAEAFATFYRFSHPRAMRRLAGQTGFEVVSMEKFVGAPCYTGFLPLLHLAFIAYHLVLEKLTPLFGFHITSVVVLKKKTEKPCTFELPGADDSPSVPLSV